MSSKRDSVDWAGLRRLPSVREKLSGFVRLRHGLSRKKTMSTLGEHQEERPSMDDSIKSGFPRVQVQDFGTSTLDIDLQALEAFRSVAQPQQPRTRPDKGAQKQKPPTTASSSTPIADMFSSKRSSILEPTSGNASSRTKPSSDAKSALANSSDDKKSSLAKSSTAKPWIDKPSPSSNISSVNKAGRAAAADGRRPGHASSRSTNASGPVVSVKIISSDHAEPQPAKPWPPPMAPRASAPIRTRVLTTSDARQPGRLQLRDPPRAAYAPSSAGPVSAAEPIARYRQQVVAAIAEADKRHSTPSTTPGSLSVGTSRTDPRRSWQQAPSSGTSTPSGPPSASAPWRNAVDRQTSARLATDRLSWIRELEQGKKNKPTISSDLTVLKTVQGSVADKLAKFESKQQQQQLPPLARSNSTRSRPASIADTFSSYGGITTGRSSLDSHRPSSVFSHYDDTFREKMEVIAGNANRKTDEDSNVEKERQEKPVLTQETPVPTEEKPVLTQETPVLTEEKPVLAQVTSAFVSVDKAYKPTCVDKPHDV
ncbi:hypothetical protein CGRA01v4_09943 [Colletotrichum graminicola]|uniref:Uncharacterized protein n=1 Tax=Colletotrichum graminicola (strain M1.001 / M2 / FGSC 10212) TaxID=645133 RepID=E3QHR3_COLGM|nr:uncharacterized protein GLRG_05545 [Colletotrichum graminicola M1.001]EFQ30401.1 hypothetical protein GLRG_05545 [Colletotrichum graminicola M1.001]WDK18658.1 hypothetical protein CGRA01v4_09943 [Colletotrichum graminicola]